MVYNNRHYVCAYGIVTEESSFYHGIINKCLPQDIEKESFRLIGDFLKKCSYLHRSSSKRRFLFHNLGKFDGNFLLDYACHKLHLAPEVLIRDNCIYKLVIFLDSVGIIFQDSYLLLPLKLSDLGQSFNKKYKKTEFSHETNCYKKYLECDAFRQNLINYCLNDCRVLCESYNVFRNLIFEIFSIDCLHSLTISSLAMKIFKSNFLMCDIENTAKDAAKADFLRKAYTGGSVELYKPYLESGFHYDINSLYASVMLKNDYPVGMGEWVDGSKIKLNSFFGFIHVRVECPYMAKPLLNYRNKDNISVAGYGEWEGIYFSEELLKAQELGYNFKFIKGLKYDRGDVFGEYVDKIYEFRLKNPNKKTPLNVTGKILLNGLYGKFGIRMENESIKIVNSKDFYPDFYPGLKNYFEIGNKTLVTYNSRKRNSMEKLKNIGALHILQEVADFEEMQPYSIGKKESAVQLAAAVTSYGRLEIYKYKSMENLGVAYSDTDSIFCLNELDPSLVSQDKLGYMKLECCFKSGIFIAPKLYYHEREDTLAIMKSKGYGGEELSKEDFLELLKENVSLPFPYESSFIRSTKDFIIKIGTKNFTIRNSVNKRDKLLDDQKKWFDTKPLFINE